MTSSNNTYKRLIAFGASVTFGHGLIDCYNFDTAGSGQTPSRLSWPALVADAMNIECDNRAECGAPNLKILLNVLSADTCTADLVIILWNISDLSILFDDVGEIIRLGPNEKNQMHLCKEFYMAHSEYDLSVRTLLDIGHSTNYLENKNVTVYNFYNDENLHNFIAGAALPLPLTGSIRYLDASVNLDQGLDGIHPGPLSHAAIADLILTHIRTDK